MWVDTRGILRLRLPKALRDNRKEAEQEFKRQIEHEWAGRLGQKYPTITWVLERHRADQKGA